MGDFGGKRWRPYLDEEARERRDKILDHLQRKYDGPTDFLKQKLMEEKALDLEERIQRAKSKEEEAKEKRERLERIKREREEQSQLRDKKDLLQEKQQKLKRLSSSDGRSRESIRSSVEEKVLERKPERFSDEEFLEKKSDRIDRMVEKQLQDSEDLDELVESVERLQDEIQELNNGEELDCFMSLEVQSI